MLFSSKKSQLKQNEFLGLNPKDLSKLAFSPWRFHKQKLLILQTVSFRHQKDFNTHRLLRAIDNNMLLSKLPKAEEGSRKEIMYPLEYTLSLQIPDLGMAITVD